MSSEALRRCQFCNSDIHTLIVCGDEDDQEWFVECGSFNDGCGATGPKADSHAGAVEAWNRVGKRIAALEDALRDQEERWRSLPSGVDEDADINDSSPKDAIAWTAGLAVLAIKQTLGERR